MTTLLLTKRRGIPSVRQTVTRVPAGHVLPGGEVVRDSFDLVWTYGARWHPEWDAPRYTCTASRFFHHGDSVMFAGDSALAFPAPAVAKGFALRHGLPVTPADEALTMWPLDIVAPEAPQPWTALIVRDPRRAQ